MRLNFARGLRKTVAGSMIAIMVATTFTAGGVSAPFRFVSVMAAEQWSSTAVYTGGKQVEYNGAIYEAQWWTQGETPGKASVWKFISNVGGGETQNNGGETQYQGGDIESPSEGLDPKVGTNPFGVKYPKSYYNKKVVGYFPNYAIGSDAHEHFNIADLQWDVLTHVQYAFGVVNKNTCEIECGDVANDIQNRFDDNTFIHKGKAIKMDESLGYYGQFNIMHTLKKMYPNVTVLISTGGWGASEGLWYATQNEASMRKFSKSAVAFIRKYGFDGIDIDFEFPSETPLSGNYTDFTESIRPGIANRYAQFIKILSEDLSTAAKQDGKYYWLTSAVSASSWVLGGQTNSDFLDYLDFVSVMSYDYHGGWNNYVENQANIYPDPADGETANMDVKTLGFDWSYKFYRGKVQSEKILMGVPYYTRGWANVSGGTNGLHGSSGNPLTNATDGLNLWCDLDANGNEVAAGANPLWHVMNLMKTNSNYKKYWDPVGKVPHIYNASNGAFLTFEDTDSVQERINYVKNQNLGGVLIWVMHGDYDYNTATGKYEVGDTLTTMFYNQFKAAGPSQVTSDIDYTNKTMNFDVDLSAGKYDHPNYTYSIKVTNRSGSDIPSGFTFSFLLPKSSNFTSSWGGTYSVRDFNYAMNEVTLTSSSGLPNNGTVEFTGMMKCCFSALKNFKLNGFSQTKEVNAEIARLNRSFITDQNDGGNEEAPTENPTQKPTETTTEVPTTAVNTSAKMTVNGFQISAVANGFRTVYTVDDPKSEVSSVGMVYGVASYVPQSDMVVGSSNSYVYDIAATANGKLDKNYGGKTSTSSYAMTMELIKTKSFLTSELYVRAYAKLKNGAVIYSDIKPVVIKDIAEKLYTREMMTNELGHSFLYNSILKVCDPSYVEIPFDYRKMLVKPY